MCSSVEIICEGWLSMVASLVVEQNLARSLIGICEPEVFDILSYFKKKESDVLTVHIKHRYPNESKEEFMQGLCEFKGFARSNIFLLSPEKNDSRQERLELIMKYKLDKVPQISVSNLSRSRK